VRAESQPARTSQTKFELPNSWAQSRSPRRRYDLGCHQTNHLLHPFDRLRTGVNSRVALRWSDQSIVPFGASTELEILPPHSPEAESGLHLIRGIISFFHRDTPGRIRVITRGAVAGVEGTEFVLAITGASHAELTTLSLIDGQVRFFNEQARSFLLMASKR